MFRVYYPPPSRHLSKAAAKTFVNTVCIGNNRAGPPPFFQKNTPCFLSSSSPACRLARYLKILRHFSQSGWRFRSFGFQVSWQTLLQHTVETIRSVNEHAQPSIVPCHGPRCSFTHQTGSSSLIAVPVMIPRHAQFASPGAGIDDRFVENTYGNMRIPSRSPLT